MKSQALLYFFVGHQLCILKAVDTDAIYLAHFINSGASPDWFVPNLLRFHIFPQ